MLQLVQYAANQKKRQKKTLQGCGTVQVFVRPKHLSGAMSTRSAVCMACVNLGLSGRWVVSSVAVIRVVTQR